MQQNPPRPEVLKLLEKYTNKDIVGIMDEYAPVGTYVLIEDKRVDAILKGAEGVNLILPSGASNANIGMIMAVGPHVSPHIKIGQLCHYNQYADLKIDLDTRTFIVCLEIDIKGIINPNGRTSYYGKGTYATLKENFNKEQTEKLTQIEKKKNIIRNRETLMVPKNKIISYPGDRPTKKK